MKKACFLLAFAICTATTQAQNVGINNPNPQASLDIIGNIKITDQTQASGKVLTSDDNGLAGWAFPTPTCFTLATDQAVGIGDYIGIGSNSSTFIRNTLVLPFSGTLVGIVFSARGAAVTNLTATIYKQNGSPGSLPAATAASATIANGALTTFATSSIFSIACLAGDLISVKITGASVVNGVTVTLLYKPS